MWYLSKLLHSLLQSKEPKRSQNQLVCAHMHMHITMKKGTTTMQNMKFFNSNLFVWALFTFLFVILMCHVIRWLKKKKKKSD